MTRLIFTLLACLAITALPAHAAKGHAHGEGELKLSVDKGRISIELEIPLDVAVGFERAPKNDKEKAALADAEKRLADTAALFIPTAAAQCTVNPAQAAEVKVHFEGKHADIEARYSFQCANPDALKGIETSLFKQFKRLYRVEAERVGPKGQGAMRLTPKQPVISW